MKRNEKQTREELIDPKLHFAGLFDNLQNQECLKLLRQRRFYRSILRNISVDRKKSAHFSNKNI